MKALTNRTTKRTSNSIVKIQRGKALWGTGASRSVISADIAKKLSLLPSGTADVNHAGGVSIKAHFDGTQVRLDEPFNLPANAALLVTVLPVSEDTDRAAWVEIGKQNLARAFADKEPEYSLADIPR